MRALAAAALFLAAHFAWAQTPVREWEIRQMLYGIAGDTSALSGLSLPDAELLGAGVATCADGGATCAGVRTGLTDVPGRNRGAAEMAVAESAQYLVDPAMEPGRCAVAKEAVPGAGPCAEGDPGCEAGAAVRTVMRCGPAVDCSTGLCGTAAVTVSHAAEIGAALASLEAARQAGTYVTRGPGGEIRVFRGETSNCRSKVAWGLGACCRPSAQGRQTTNMQALAELGVTHALRGVLASGSEHTHDVLFSAETLKAGLGSMSVGGIAQAFSPSLSFYGLEVAVTEGALSFGFDPTSFAVAVALSVISNMLRCHQDEQILSMRIGAGLCDATAEWCSKKRLFSCKERTRTYCCYNSRLARLVARQGLAQIGAPARCDGFTTAEFRRLDFGRIDISSFVSELSPSVDPALVERYRRESGEAAARAAADGTPQVTVE